MGLGVQVERPSCQGAGTTSRYPPEPSRGKADSQLLHQALPPSQTLKLVSVWYAQHSKKKTAAFFRWGGVFFFFS